jgi:hydrogenase 3 maturation protease
MSSLLTAEVIKALRFSSDTGLVITVGNSLRSDDGVGPYIAERLTAIKRIPVIDAGFSPENSIDDIIRRAPETIIVIDAADFGGGAGEVRIIPEEIITQTTMSTHAIPLNVITRIIAGSIRTEVRFIGIQPKTVVFGEGLSPEVGEAADAIIDRIKQNFPAD